MDADYKLSKMANNVLYNKKYGMKKPFDELKYFKIMHLDKMNTCNSCGLDSTQIENLLIELVHEN